MEGHSAHTHTHTTNHCLHPPPTVRSTLAPPTTTHAPASLVNTLNVSVVPLEEGEYKLYIYFRGQQFFVGQPIRVTGETIHAEELIKKVRHVRPDVDVHVPCANRTQPLLAPFGRRLRLH